MPKPDPLEPIREALEMILPDPDPALVRHLDAALRSSVRAVVPGRQQAKNLAPLLAGARKAFARTLRRRARS